MGFGLLFIGYFIASIMSLNTLSGVFYLAGYLIMIFASRKLSQYSSCFKLLLAASAVMALLSVGIAVGDISSLLCKYLLISAPLMSEFVYGLFVDIRTFSDFFFVAILCFCIRKIAKETGADQISYAAVRNFVFYCISFVLQIIVWVSSNTQYAKLTEFVQATYLVVWTFIIVLVVWLFIAWMLFSCYAKICDENDVDMEQKPSRFKFVNKWREKRQLKRQQLVKQEPRYTEEQQKRAAVAQKNQKKKKR